MLNGYVVTDPRLAAGLGHGTRTCDNRRGVRHVARHGGLLCDGGESVAGNRPGSASVEHPVDAPVPGRYVARPAGPRGRATRWAAN
jgi:hypothetical protein